MVFFDCNPIMRGGLSHALHPAPHHMYMHITPSVDESAAPAAHQPWVDAIANQGIAVRGLCATCPPRARTPRPQPFQIVSELARPLRAQGWKPTITCSGERASLKRERNGVASPD